ncbi:hypothetical protein NDS46_21835 [Paenibacillus thiaminolyticus]|uniref:hypothetical protein n=1 Tax=Paenibacillus thiaminolyticus TaxID=49283 RepID=UPI00232E5C70|nr:hypothetical protein [Paenibacillus thiaminolyticus]WCF06958.1 hypothetical protein NDS46_21835 [Paenibacillus thiaminolyticus]
MILPMKKSFLQLNDGMNVAINNGLILIGHELTEDDFKRYGMNKNTKIDFYNSIQLKSFVSKSPSVFKEGKVFKKILDTNKISINKIHLIKHEERELTFPPLKNSYSNGKMRVNANMERDQYGTKYYAYYAFSDDMYWEAWSLYGNTTTGILTAVFNKPVIANRCNVQCRSDVESLQLDALSGGEYEKMSSFGRGRTFNFSFNSNKKRFTTFRWTFKRGFYSNVEVSRIRLFGPYIQLLLIKHNNVYKRFDGNSWVGIGESVGEADFIDYGNDPESISEEAWAKLDGEIEINYYIDDLNIDEATISIETKPFTLAEEFDDQTIKIIEYTDDPLQEDATITLETEPFAFYDEVGDSFDVLYYTDDPEVTDAQLEINHNYSPLDELEGDFELVTWTMEEVAEVQEKLRPIFIENIKNGELYGTTVDLSKAILNIK